MIALRKLEGLLLVAARTAKRSPTLRRLGSRLLVRLPRVRSRLGLLVLTHGRAASFGSDALSPRSRQVYEDIKSTRECAEHAEEPWDPARPRLAFVSPLPPTRSGIADYSAELLPELGRYYEIELITDQPAISPAGLAAGYPIRSVAWFEKHRRRYARVLYQLGNSAVHQQELDLLRRHPGVVVLHDFFLSDVMEYLDATGKMPGLFAQSLFLSHGYAALKMLVEEGSTPTKLRFSCNLPVIQRAVGVIVHSQANVALAREIYGDKVSRFFKQVPFLREARAGVPRDTARTALGIGRDEFVVCSFGVLSPAKLSHRLLQSWLLSDCASRGKCRLVFIGDDGLGDYARALRREIERRGVADRVLITGFAEPEEYSNWLAAADVAVQLRAQSRGETSAGIFDCLAAGVPLVVNDHGSVTELPDSVLVRLPDGLSDEQLAGALQRLRDDDELRERLSRAGRDYVKRKHGRAQVGAAYRDAIEGFYSEHPLEAQRRLVEDVACGDPAHYLTDEDIEAAAQIIAAAQPSAGPRQLFVDVSSLVREDLRTGIQRVTRAVLRELLLDPPSGFWVEPVYGMKDRYYYARHYSLVLLGLGGFPLIEAPIDAYDGDVFLGLDLAPDLVPDCREELQRMRAKGVHLAWVVYDLLPVRLPDFFPEVARASFSRWLQTVAELGHSLIAISRATEREVVAWLDASGQTEGARPRTDFFRLGADFQKSVPTRGLPSSAERVLTILAQRPTFLMVGTIEPRKGHAQVLEAFDKLWAQGHQLNLVIVGKHGWMVDSLADRLRRHPQRRRMLHWLEQVSDEYLERIYSASTALIAASYGEGFGLPLIEAAQHRLPIIARDLPVFREVAQDHAYYFDAGDGDGLAESISAWLKLYAQRKVPSSEAIERSTWQQSKESLVAALLRDSRRAEKSR